MKDIVVMNPTVTIATQRFKDFVRCNERLISAVYKTQRKVKLLNDRYIFFKGETEGENALLGLYADVISYAEFLDIWVMR